MRKTFLNRQLQLAKQNKKDEFYTAYSTVENEIHSYFLHDQSVFENKIILCPCDDPHKSNFFKYLVDHFNEYKIKQLVCCCYSGKPDLPFTLTDEEYIANGQQIRTAWKATINEVSSTDSFDVFSNPNNSLTQLNGSGDFRSREVTNIRDTCDIIITNPPFSLFREFYTWCQPKKFIVLGTLNAISYRAIFPTLFNGTAHFGKTLRKEKATFVVPGQDLVTLNNSIWYTNLEHGYQPPFLELKTTKEVFENIRHKELVGKTKFDRYDTFDAIDIPYLDMLPSDYDDVMGVPVSFYIKWNPLQFDILGITVPFGRPKGWSSKTNMDPLINGVEVYKRLLIKRK
jgi:hypothetical protein